MRLISKVVGEGGPATVLVHGFMGSSWDWAQVQSALAAQRAVIAFDHRGHGRSPRGDYSFDLLVGDVVALISELGPVDLVGHSMGGVIAMRCALEHPQLVRSLVLLDTAAAPAGLIPSWALALLGLAARVARLTTRSRDHPGILAKLGMVDPAAIAALGVELNGYPSMLEQLPRIAVPTMVIVGERDKGLRASADEMAQLIRDARLEVVSGAGHNPQHDRPAEVIRLLESHLAQL